MTATYVGIVLILMNMLLALNNGYLFKNKKCNKYTKFNDSEIIYVYYLVSLGIGQVIAFVSAYLWKSNIVIIQIIILIQVAVLFYIYSKWEITKLKHLVNKKTTVLLIIYIVMFLYWENKLKYPFLTSLTADAIIFIICARLLYVISMGEDIRRNIKFYFVVPTILFSMYNIFVVAFLPSNYVALFTIQAILAIVTNLLYLSGILWHRKQLLL